MGDGMEEQSDGDLNQTTALLPLVPISQFLDQNYKSLPWYEKLCFKHASLLMAANSSVCGLMANNLFRKALKVRRSYLLSSLPVTALPFVFVNFYHELLITQPLLNGFLNCPTCAVVRGGYIGVCMGGVAPVVLAGYINLLMAPRSSKTPLQGSILQGILHFTKPVFSKLKYFLLFEAVASIVIPTGQFAVMEKLRQMSPVSETPEEPKE